MHERVVAAGGEGVVDNVCDPVDADVPAGEQVVVAAGGSLPRRWVHANPAHGRLLPVAVVRGEPDALLWVCHRRGMEVVAYPEAEIQQLRHDGPLPPFR